MENHHETEFFKNLIKKDVKQEWSKLRKKFKTHINQSEMTAPFCGAQERKQLNKNVMTSIEEN